MNASDHINSSWSGFHLESAMMDRVFHAYYPLLLIRAREIVGDSAAHDVVMDGFVAVIKKERNGKVKFSDERELIKYIYTTVYSKCIDLTRSRKIERKFLAAVRHADIGEADDNAWAKELMIDRAYNLLLEWIEELPVVQKEMVNRLLDGRSVDEISIEFNVEKATVRSNLFKARKNLKRRVVDHPDAGALVVACMGTAIIINILQQVH